MQSMILLSMCGKHLQDHISSLREEARAHTTSFIPPLDIEVHVKSMSCNSSAYYCLRTIEIQVSIQ
jgi:hypothetical protein